MQRLVWALFFVLMACIAGAGEVDPIVWTKSWVA